MWSKPPLYLPTSEVQGECRAELARALLNRSLHSQFYIAKLRKIIETTKDKVEKKLSKFDKFFSDEASANVTMRSQKNDEILEITIFYKNNHSF